MPSGGRDKHRNNGAVLAETWSCKENAQLLGGARGGFFKMETELAPERGQLKDWWGGAGGGAFLNILRESSDLC